MQLNNALQSILIKAGENIHRLYYEPGTAIRQFISAICELPFTFLNTILILNTSIN